MDLEQILSNWLYDIASKGSAELTEKDSKALLEILEDLHLAQSVRRLVGHN